MFELDTTLETRGKKAEQELLAQFQPAAGAMSFTRQQAPLGLGHAVWCARDLVGNEPFAVLLPDMIMRGDPGCLAQMVAVYRQTGGNVISVEECDPQDTRSYGIVGVGDSVGDNAFKITAMVEKPAPRDAPSNLFINGRYILQPTIFDLLAKQQRGAGNEIQLTDAMKLLSELRPFTGVRFNGRSFDCGSKIGFLTANVAFALGRDDLRDGLTKEIEALLAEARA